MIDIFKITEDSPIPKYRQLIGSVHDAIESKELKRDHKMPSVNEIANKFNLSRDTVLTAFGELQARGIIKSRPGKGYYVAKPSVKSHRKIFLLFDRLTSYKEVLFDAFKKDLKRLGTVEIFFHNFNIKTFETLIHDSIGQYTDYVIMPIPTKSVAGAINQVPKDKLYILDRGRRQYGQLYPSVCQSFKKDIYNALHSGLDLLAKYDKLIMLIPENSHAPMELQRGFKKFCGDNSIPFAITKRHAAARIEHGKAYLVLDDNTLVSLVQEAQEKQLQLGKDVGIISYNDTPLKSIAANGITTISTDFRQMGKTLADLIIHKKKDHIENPCFLIRRNSL